MHKWRAVILILFLGCAVAFGQPTNEPAPLTIEAAEEMEMLTNGVWLATNGVTVRYQEAVLTARKASVNQLTGEVAAQGDVRLQRGPDLLVADSVQYNFLTKKIIGDNLKFGQNPYFLQSDIMVGDQNANIYVGASGFITTDDYANPDYRVRAKTLIIVPGEYVIAKNATLWLGNVPVFYFPYYRRSLKHRSNHFVATPGYRSRFGPFLLTSYNWYWEEKLDGAIHLDERGRLDQAVTVHLNVGGSEQTIKITGILPNPDTGGYRLIGQVVRPAAVCINIAEMLL